MRIITLLAALGAVVITSSCAQSDSTNENSVNVSDVEFVDAFDDFISSAIDTVLYSDDGSYALYGMGHGPLNSLLEYFDSEGRVLLTQTQASECEPQTLLYHYDNAGLLSEIHSISYNCDIFDQLTGEAIAARRMYNHIDSAIHHNTDSLIWSSTSTIRFERSDDKQRIVAITGLYPLGEIVAPSGKSLTVRIRPADSFWQSDLHGGRYVLELPSVH